MANWNDKLGRDRLLYNNLADSDTEHMRRNEDYYADPWRGLGSGTVVQGPYTGYGPRGYHHSDERIKEDVCDLLTQSGEIDASDMEVSVKNGEVTLQGTVDRRWTKRAAEALADTVYGVADVHNELHIRGQGTAREAKAQAGESERAQTKQGAKSAGA